MHSRSRSRFPLLLVPAIGLLFAGCSGNPSSPSPAGSVSLRLDHVVEGSPLVPDAGEYVNAAGNVYRVESLRYFISNVILRRAGGPDVVLGGAHLRDIDDDATRTWTMDVPDGTYDEIRFTFGLDDTMNVSGRLGSSQAVTNMAWPEPWGGGYHYMMFEGKFHGTPPDTLLQSFALHMGATIPPGETVRQHFYVPVTLALAPPLTVAGDDHELGLVMDLNRWFDGPDTLDLAGWLNPRMQDPAALDTLEANGGDVFTVDD